MFKKTAKEEQCPGVSVALVSLGWAVLGRV